MMVAMLFVASKQTNDMQDEDYYITELNYQEVIDGKNNLARLGEKVRIADSAGYVRIAIPVVLSGNITDGRIHFMRPSDKSKDRNMPLVADRSGMQLIKTDGFINGLYAVEISWTHAGKKYYAKENLFINK
jgi:hypothetical protein